MGRFLIVCAAGGLGCGIRYLVGLWIGARAFPYATLAVNLIGCFLMGLVMELVLRISSFPPNLRLALTTGFMGGLTTFSAFNYETTQLASDVTWRAVLYVAITLLGCVVAGLLGMWLARRMS